ncbi:diaminopimelate epimerase [Virgibacillus xinjiangensis]|uniref:Diaminopimelate epimerase n=1 Tax=Virgibacillus xinjiangensis TaxID=393090 RepID=A0ABV7CYA5_9BACI
MEIPFTKMHGLGNNYIYIDLFQYTLAEEILPLLAKSVSDIHTGVGADGLILIQPSERSEVGMRIFNKDGSEGNTCGNGLRCTAKYAYEQGYTSSERFNIETKANIVEAEVKSDGQVTINMGKPLLRRSEIPMMGHDDPEVVAEPFPINQGEWKVTAVSMGNPHAVFFVEAIEDAPVEQMGPLIEKDQRFPDSVNVEFVEVISPQELNFRVWERGSGITQACGTGACAAAVAAILNDHAELNDDITVHLLGGDLVIRWDVNGEVWMTGGAEVIAAGTYYFHQTQKVE